MQNAQDAGTAPPGDGRVAGGEQQTVGGVVAGAKQAAGQMAADLKEKAVTKADEKKDTAAETLGTVAQALRGAAQNLEQGQQAALGTYAQSAAEQVDKVARYLREKDLQGLTRDTETFARRHPELFLGGAFLAGMLAARFVKSSRPRAVEGSGTFAGGAETSPFNPPHFASETTGGE